MNTPEPTIADTTSPTRTVPAGPSAEGEPSRSSGAAGGTPCVDRATPVLAEFVGGPRNGYVIEVEPVSVIPGEGGAYLLALGHHERSVYAWHVPGPFIAGPVDELRPAAPVEHVRPANREGEQTRPRRARRSGR